MADKLTKSLDTRITKLPLWAQRHIFAVRHELEQEVASHNHTRSVHALTASGRNWFVLGQANEFVSTLETPCGLYVPRNGDIVRVCDLGRGDALLVSRSVPTYVAEKAGDEG